MDFKKLQGNEIPIFKRMLDKYKGYDVIDLLIHKTLKSVGTLKKDFINRKVKLNKEDKVVVVQSEADQLNKFCDGDKCELPILKSR